MQKLLIIISTSIYILFLFSCSKEKQLEKTLYNKEGIWNVKTAIWNQYSKEDTIWSDTSGISSYSGWFQFTKDNSGYPEFNINDVYYWYTFEWFIENQQVYIYAVHEESHNTSGVIDFVVTIFLNGNLTEDESGMILSGTETIDHLLGEKNVLSVTIQLEKN